MKKTLITFTLLLFAFAYANAQRKGGKQKIKAFKIAFITEKLDLSETEATKFWPLYNDFEKSKRALFKKEREGIRMKIKAAGGIENITEEEAKKYLSSMHEIKTKKHNLKSKFHEDIATILPYKKILQLEIAEHEFNRKLMKRLRKRK